MCKSAPFTLLLLTPIPFCFGQVKKGPPSMVQPCSPPLASKPGYGLVIVWKNSEQYLFARPGVSLYLFSRRIIVPTPILRTHLSVLQDLMSVLEKKHVELPAHEATAVRYSAFIIMLFCSKNTKRTHAV